MGAPSQAHLAAAFDWLDRQDVELTAVEHRGDLAVWWIAVGTVKHPSDHCEEHRVELAAASRESALALVRLELQGRIARDLATPAEAKDRLQLLRGAHIYRPSEDAIARVQRIVVDAGFDRPSDFAVNHAFLDLDGDGYTAGEVAARVIMRAHGGDLDGQLSMPDAA
jgi:hypothetical protein